MIICKYCVPLRILGKINIIKTSLIEKSKKKRYLIILVPIFAIFQEVFFYFSIQREKILFREFPQRDNLCCEAIFICNKGVSLNYIFHSVLFDMK